MKSISLAFTLASLLSASFISQKELGWRGIVPLHSTRADVESLLGTPTDQCKCNYKTADGEVFVEYARSPCKGAISGGRLNLPGWNVPADTVLRFTVYSKTEQRFSTLSLDLSKYVLSQDDTFTSYYASRDDGIEYEVSAEGIVKALSYIPLTKDHHLRCPGFPLEDGSIPRHRPFDQYGDIDFEKEKVRLDGLAIMLQQEPNMKGHIIVYAGQRAVPGEARARAERAKNYLVNVRHTEAGRVVIIDGGHREKLTVELYALPRDSPAPSASPTVSPNEVQIIKASSAKKSKRLSTRPRYK
jgi:hypothetical protein